MQSRLDELTNKIEFYIGNEDTLKEICDAKVEEIFSENRIEFLDALSKKIRSDREAKNYPDITTFAFWIRKANMVLVKKKYQKVSSIRMGRGVVFHIAPSNVAVNYAYSWASAFVTGNANIVRLSSKEFVQIDIINRCIKEVLLEERFVQYRKQIIFVRYDRNREINDLLSAICDVRVIWGGDATIKELRKSELQPRATEITFADRYSICVIDADYYVAIQDKKAIAKGFYNDTYLTDQNACTSPRLLCWMGDSENIKLAKKEFWSLLHEQVSEKYHFQDIQYIDKLTEFYMAAVKLGNMHIIREKDNRITRIAVNRIDKKLIEHRGHSGYFYEYDAKDIFELEPLCNEKLQTISYCGMKENIKPLVLSGVKGIDRIVEIGKTMEFSFIWDGYDLVEKFSRRIQMYGNDE